MGWNKKKSVVDHSPVRLVRGCVIMASEAGTLRVSLCALALLVFPPGREVSAWLHQGSRSGILRQEHISVCLTGQYQQVALPTRAATSRGRCYLSPNTLARAKRHQPTTTVFATEEGGEEGASPTGEIQTAENDTPIFYIRGLTDGGGVRAWGDDPNAQVDEGEVRKVVRNVRQGQGEGEGEVGRTEVEEVQPEGFDWERLQKSLGLGTWSYVGLGTAIFVLVLNHTLGLGWLGRLLGGDFDTEGIVDVEGQRQQQVQILQLDDDSNLLR